MIAVEGIYDNGKIELFKMAPEKFAKVIVIFPEEEKKEQKTLAVEEIKAMFDEFTGCLDGEIDEKAERLEALDEKYANFD